MRTIRIAGRAPRARAWPRRVAVALALASTAGAVGGACGNSSDDLPPLERNIPNPYDGGSDVADVVVIGDEIPDPEAPCDDGLALNELDPLKAAKAVEICQLAKDGQWGLLDARWTLPDGTAVATEMEEAYHHGHGLMASFGTLEPQAGKSMLALSSGWARLPTDPDYALDHDKAIPCEFPKGFPKPAPACPDVTPGKPQDAAALEVQLRAPPGAAGFSFRFNFHTSEWPQYICSPYNDAFIALLSPPPANHPDGNVSFDVKGNPVSVNNAFVRACTCDPNPSPCEFGGKKFKCELGPDPLVGTGFETHAATGWLKTQALVTGGSEITLRWAIYDSGDGIYDSTTLVDQFQWLGHVEDAGTAPDDLPE